MEIGRTRLVALALAALVLAGATVVRAQDPGIKVYPDNGYSDVSPGTSIMVYFSEAMDTGSVEAAFALTPAAAGTFHWADGNKQMSYRPTEPLEARTSYRGELGTGIRTARGTAPLSSPYRWSFTTSQDYQKIGFGYRVPVQFVTPDGGRGVPIQPGYPRQTLDLELFSVDVAAFTQRYAALQPGSGAQIDTSGLPRVAAWKTHIDFTDSTGSIALPAGTAPGLYLLDARSARAGGAQTFVIFSNYAVVAKAGRDSRLAWVTRVRDGSPVSAAAVALYDARGVEVGAATADADGVARFTAPTAKFAFARVAGETTLVGLDENWLSTGYYWGWWGRGWQTEPPEFVAHQHTDRPIYRPGHTVHYKSTIRRMVGNEFQVVGASQLITVTMRDVSGNAVATTTPRADAFGSIAGDLVLGEDAAVGTWRFEIQVGAQTFTGYFEVQEYVKPDYEVKVATDKPFYITGETAVVQVQADYYFGQPASGADVTLRVFQDYYYWYNRSGNQVGEFKGKTDAEGSFEVRVPVSVEMGRDYAKQYFFEAEVTDASRRPVVHEGSAPVYPAAFDLSLTAERYGVEVGQPVRFTVSTMAHDGTPATGRVVYVSARQWRYYEGRGSYYEEIKRVQVTTGSDGTAVVELPGLAEGWYEVQAEATDDGGRLVRQNSWAWVWNGERPWYWHGDMEMQADRESYAAGETAKLLVKTPYTQPTTALLTLEREEVLEQRIIQLQGAATIDVPIRADFAPNVWAKVVLWQPVQDGYNRAEARLVTAMVNLTVPATDRHLEVAVDPDAEKHAPRETATFTVRVADAAGAPVDAQISFALVDASVLALAADRSGDIFDAFWSSRGDTVSTYDSLQPTTWYDYPAREDMGGPGRGPAPAPGAPGTATPAGTQAPTNKDEAGQSQPRREFPDTAYWAPAIETGPDGVAEVTLTLPDSLTTWRALVRAVTVDTRVGQGSGDLVVTQPIVADIALPRFAVQGDEFALDVLGRNYVGGELQATTTLDAPGLVMLDPGSRTLQLPMGETRFARYSVVASVIGENPVTARVTTPAGGDALELPLEVDPFAVPERFSRAGSTDSSVVEAFDVPFNAVPDDSNVEVRLAPGMALGVIDGLEELIGYPYGCVEQTMSRVLPNAVIGRLLRVLEIEAPEITSQLPEMMALGLQKLYGFQNPNGSWGWWHWQYSEGNVYTTSYVLQGLLLVKEAGFDVDGAVLTRGFTWLAAAVDAEADPRLQAYAAYVLALGGQPKTDLIARLYDRRSELDPFALAALAIAAKETGADAISNGLLDELERRAVVGTTTASWPVNWSDQRYHWYYWYAMANTEKSTAMALEALATLRPQSPLAPKAARWLMENRWGSGWQTTQGTAFAVLALTDYLLASGELDADYTYAVTFDGAEVARGTVNRDNLTDRIDPIVIDGARLTPGAHHIEISRVGQGSIFYTIVGRLARYYDGFAATTAEGLGIGVAREYATVAGRGGTSGWAVGDVVNVRLTLDLSEDLRYVIVEDLLPAGFEPLNESLATESGRVPGQEPGYPYYWRWYGYERKEMRDDRVTFFASHLPAGKHSFDYAARVITPGVFSARPAEAYTMYRPEVWGRSASAQVMVAPDRVVDRPDLAGDFDRDCRLTDFDASLVADAWAAGGKRDVNGDGRTDVADIATAGGRDGLVCGDRVPLPPGSAGDMTLSLEAPERVQQGETFTVAVTTEGSGNVGGYELTLDLPAGAFEVVGLQTGDRLPDARLLGPVGRDGTLRLGGFAPTGTEGAGKAVLGRVQLRALVAGDIEIGVARAMVTTDHGGTYRVTAGGVIVSPEPWTPRGTVMLPLVQR